MPASIVHMLVAREVRSRIRGDPSLGCRAFLANLPQYETCMNLGALGPDLPYFASRLKGLLDLAFERSDKPMESISGRTRCIPRIPTSSP
jgi:hypothetical protein